MSSETILGRPVRREPRECTPAFARTLEWADAAAWRRDYVDALGWLELLEQIGYQLPAEYDAKRQAWLAVMPAAEF